MELLTKAETVARDKKTYFPHLDALRGIAIVMVVAFHAFSFEPTSPKQFLVLRFLSSLSHGVPLFFVLSGFLISMIVFEENKPFRWHTYSMRRVAKIAPPFLLSLVVFALQGLHKHQSPDLLVQIPANLATLPNLMYCYKMINPVSWSLFIELHFYIALPLIFFAFRRVFRTNAELLTIITFTIIPVVLRILSWKTNTESIAERFFLLNRFPNAMDYFAWGMAFTYIFKRYHQAPQFETYAQSFSISGLILLPIFAITFTSQLAIYNIASIQQRMATAETSRLLICVTAFLLLFSAVTKKPNSVIDSRALRYVGLVSYEWFLFHLAVIPWLRYHIGHSLHLPFSPLSSDGTCTLLASSSFVIITLVSILASFAASALIYHFYSQPLLKILRKY